MWCHVVGVDVVSCCRSGCGCHVVGGCGVML